MQCCVFHIPMLMKRYPQLQPYRQNTSEQFANIYCLSVKGGYEGFVTEYQ